MAEDFGKLFEKYMTGSLEKYYSDFDYIDSPTIKKKRVEFEDGQYIEMNNFIEEYLPGFVDCSRHVKGLTHATLKKLTAGNLIGIDNDFAFYNPQYLKNKYLIVVCDYNGDFGTYLNHKLLDEYIKAGTAREDIKKMSKTIYHDMKVVRIIYMKLQKAIETFEQHAELYEGMAHLIDATNTEQKVRRLRGDRNKNDKH